MTLPPWVDPRVQAQNLMLGTVTTADVDQCLVTLDGAESEITTIVPRLLQPYLLDVAAVDARVMVARVGGLCYVTDLISGGA